MSPARSSSVWVESPTSCTCTFCPGPPLSPSLPRVTVARADFGNALLMASLNGLVTLASLLSNVTTVVASPCSLKYE